MALNVVENLNQHGYVEAAIPSPPSVQYPAEDDLKTHIIDNSTAQSETQEKLDDVIAKIDRFIYKETDPLSILTDLYNEEEQRLKRAKPEQSVLEKLPITLGQALYSFGEVLSANDSVIDRAFIEVQDAIALPEENSLPTAQLHLVADPRLDKSKLRKES